MVNGSANFRFCRAADESRIREGSGVARRKYRKCRVGVERGSCRAGLFSAGVLAAAGHPPFAGRRWIIKGTMLDIDGSHGEGGGQLLRTACALAAITGKPSRIFNIRARRMPPGLAPQHLTAVKAVAALCGAEVDGLEPRSAEIVFRPGRLRGGEFHFDVGTAGSITLVLQALLPPALMCGAAVRIRLIGGTDIRAAPPLDYLRFVLLPHLLSMGAEVELTLERRGYYPRGGGVIGVQIAPRTLQPLRRELPARPTEIHGIAHVSNLPAHIAMRMQHTAEELLSGIAPVRIEPQVLGREQAVGAGGALVLWARSAHTLLGGAEVAQRGVPAERIAANAAEALREEMASGATVDIHAADQLPVYCALAGGPSRFLTRTLSSHAQTALWLLPQFLPLRIDTRNLGACTQVEIELPRRQT
jgi:RNA 3'-terminal phosphate cyclase (ATP)/RNA 3'-terminal phosphate cyclase (GTP)